MTYYGLSWETFTPEINYEAYYVVENFEFSLIYDHPFGLIICLSWILFIILSIVLCNILNKKTDYPCVSQKDIPLLSKKDPISIVIQPELINKISKYDFNLKRYDIHSHGKDLNMHTYNIKKIFKLCLLRMRNNHYIFGICFRDNGTNVTTFDRLFLLLFKVLVSFAVGSLFYGIERDTIIGD